MRKLLNNPRVVAVLALVALACVVGSLWPEQMTGNSAPAAEVAPEAPAHSAGPHVADATAPQSGEELMALTGTAVRRDPFAPSSRTVAIIAAVEKAKPDLLDTVRLSALWSQDGATYAVINGSIARAGDEFGRLKIESATTDGVWLVHWQGRDHLAVGAEFTLRTPAAGPAAPASPL
jgi:hypothetical protein